MRRIILHWTAFVSCPKPFYSHCVCHLQFSRQKINECWASWCKCWRKALVSSYVSTLDNQLHPPAHPHRSTGLLGPPPPPPPTTIILHPPAQPHRSSGLLGPHPSRSHYNHPPSASTATQIYWFTGPPLVYNHPESAG